MITNLPVNGVFTVTAAFGDKNSALWGASGHSGVDIVNSDRKIYATCDGVVRVVDYDANGFGQYVTVGDDAGRIHIFAHLVKGSVLVQKGQKVDRKTQIGIMGATGNVTGVHLHYQINDLGGIPQDPTPYLGIPNKRGTNNSADYALPENAGGSVSSATPTHWAQKHYDSLVKKGILDGGETSKVWLNFDAPVSLLKVGELLALIDKGTK